MIKLKRESKRKRAREKEITHGKTQDAAGKHQSIKVSLRKSALLSALRRQTKTIEILHMQLSLKRV